MLTQNTAGTRGLDRHLAVAIGAIFVIVALGVAGAILGRQWGAIPIMLLNAIVGISVLRALRYLTHVSSNLNARFDVK
jgi:hypothetical protein